MMRSEQNFYNQRADLNMEVQILIELLRAVYITVWRPFAFLNNKYISYDSKIVKIFLLFLAYFYLLIVILPFTIVWYLILGYQEVKDMFDEAVRVIRDGGELGYCGLMIAYQRSEDVDQED